jgi:DNA-binding NarL/FixJ family response regulator
VKTIDDSALSAGESGPDAAPRVVVIEDDTFTRDRILQFVELDVLAAYPTAEAYLSDHDRPDADLIVLDLLLHQRSGEPTTIRGVRAIKAIRALGGQTGRILLYTSEHRRPVLVSCLAAGADGLVLKSEPTEAFLTAVRRVAAGETVITSALTGLVELFQRRGKLPVVSGNKLEVLRGRARGEPYKLIANRLNLEVKTVQDYMAATHQIFQDYLRQIGADGLDSEGRFSPALMENHLGLASGDLGDTDSLSDG